jgi:hypothetical protein
MSLTCLHVTLAIRVSFLSVRISLSLSLLVCLVSFVVSLMFLVGIRVGTSIEESRIKGSLTHGEPNNHMDRHMRRFLL